MLDDARPSRLLLDANGILRYLRNDLPAQADIVRARLGEAQKGRLILELHPLILAEVIFVLESFYSVPRQKIAPVLSTFLDTPGIKLYEEDRTRNALARYAEKNVSFVDAFLAALGVEKAIPVFSFDKGLDKFKDLRRIEK